MENLLIGTHTTSSMSSNNIVIDKHFVYNEILLKINPTAWYVCTMLSYLDHVLHCM